jgi:hypothetical protein
MGAKKAFIASGIFFTLALIWIWSTEDPYPVIIYDQDAIINGVWRSVTIGISFIVSALLFLLLMLISPIKKLASKILWTAPKKR